MDICELMQAEEADSVFVTPFKRLCEQQLAGITCLGGSKDFNLLSLWLMVVV